MINIRPYVLALVLLALSTMACDIEMVTPTPTPTEKYLPTVTAMIQEDPTQVWAGLIDESQHTPVGTIVTVTHGTVNLRKLDHAAAAVFVQEGQVLAVECGPDGYCKILDGDHAGLYIWRGCTSDPDVYGCEAK